MGEAAVDAGVRYVRMVEVTQDNKFKVSLPVLRKAQDVIWREV